MARGARSLTAWLVVLTLAGGPVLAGLTASGAADPDGACGPALLLPRTVVHFEATAGAAPNHCVACHLWQALTSACASPSIVVPPPAHASRRGGRPTGGRAEQAGTDVASPRGPPTAF